MPAPLGNKFAANHSCGRPSKFDKKIEAIEFLKWAQTDDAFVLRMFAPMRGYSFETLTRWAEEDEEFGIVYHMCKDLVGARRELRLIMANSSTPFQRYATFYDEHLKLHEHAEKAYEKSLEAENQSKGTTLNVNYSTDSAAYRHQQVPSETVSEKHT